MKVILKKETSLYKRIGFEIKFKKRKEYKNKYKKKGNNHMTFCLIMDKKWQKVKIISPFVPKQTRKGRISMVFHHTDMMQEFQMILKIFTNVNSTIVDPKNFKKDGLYQKIKYLCNTTKLFCFSQNCRIL